MTGRSVEAIRAALLGEVTSAAAHQLARELLEADLGLAPLRVAVLASCSLDFIRSQLVVAGARAGFRLAPYFGPFGQIEQELQSPDSGLWREPPDVLVLMIRPEDVAPDALTRPLRSGSVPLAGVVDDLVERIDRAVGAFRSQSPRPVLVANFAEPAMVPLGVLDANGPISVTEHLARANAALRARLSAHAGAIVWDVAGFVRGIGASAVSDPRLWMLARIPVAAAHQPALAAHLVRTTRAAVRPPAKCLALDLDNTLWGGVIGDDGLSGIQLGDDYPGNVFKDFQRRALALADRGILLAVVSKNDHSVAEEAFHRHPEMLIRWPDLAAARIGWGPKSVALREIAHELNIGADQIVFFDDNPVERAEVLANAPEVLVADVPTNPLGYAACLASLPWFDQVTISDEDRRRAAQYQERRARLDAESSAASVEDFLAGLEMRADVGVADDTTIGRIVQLVNKTNQFNLTTRRYEMGEMAQLRADPSVRIVWIRVEDRFGDQGLIGVAIVRAAGEAAELDTFLMSCRVMNRRVEVALLAYAAEQARGLGCRVLRGTYRATAKNGMVHDLLPALGFTAADAEGTTFALPLTPEAAPWPPVIARRA
jgi:FkbH-like protein